MARHPPEPGQRGGTGQRGEQGSGQNGTVEVQVAESERGTTALV